MFKVVIAGSKGFEDYHGRLQKKPLPRNSLLAKTVNADVAMKVAGMVVTIRMRDDQGLMAGKEFLGKLHANGLYTFGCQAILITITGIKANDIVMRFHIFLLKILMELLV